MITYKPFFPIIKFYNLYKRFEKNYKIAPFIISIFFFNVIYIYIYI